MLTDDWLDGAAWRALERAYAMRRDARKAWARRVRRTADDPIARALARGGYAVAGELVEAQLARGLAPPSAIDYLIETGQRERARELATEPHHRAALGLAAPLEPIHPFVLARAGLDTEAVRALLVEHPRALLESPQLHLLAGWFGRYLRAMRLPRAELPAPTTRFLDDVWFPAPPRAAGGPLVSVLVSAYRARDTIAYAIDSLLAQTYPDLEILVCDDASDDDTSAILERRYARVPRVRRFRGAANQGTYNVRNALLPHARGELITFHDADDVALPTRIAAQVRRLAAGAEVSMTTLLRVTPEGRFVIFRNGDAARLAMVSMMCARHALDALGGFRPARFGADLDAYERLRDRGARIDVLRAPLILGAVAPTSMTRAAGLEALDDGFRAPARRAYCDLLHARALGKLPDAEISRALQHLGNWAEPAPITSRT